MRRFKTFYNHNFNLKLRTFHVKLVSLVVSVRGDTARVRGF